MRKKIVMRLHLFSTLLQARTFFAGCDILQIVIAGVWFQPITTSYDISTSEWEPLDMTSVSKNSAVYKLILELYWLMFELSAARVRSRAVPGTEMQCL